MTDNPTHPYTLEIIPSKKQAGLFEWALRRHGSLIQRSDRLHRSEAEARKDGEKAIERQFSDRPQPTLA